MNFYFASFTMIRGFALPEDIRVTRSLKAFLASLGLEKLSAQDMRHQYVLHQKAAGKSLLEVSRNLGLKSPVTLEKFYN